MILFMNAFVTGDIPPYSQYPPIETADRFDVLKYQLGSYSLIPWAEARIFLELDEKYKHRQAELDEWVCRCFSNHKLIYSNDRNTSISKWKSSLAFLNDLPKCYPVWYTCNADHPFIAPDLSIVNKIDDLFMKDDNIYKNLMFTHWSEFLYFAVKHGYNWEGDDFVYFPEVLHEWSHSIYVMPAAFLLKWFMESDTPDDIYAPRSDWAGPNGRPVAPNRDRFITYVPMEELCRHFEAYYHIKIPYHLCPQLTIPDDFGLSFSLRKTQDERTRIITSCFQDSTKAREHRLECPREFIEWRSVDA